MLEFPGIRDINDLSRLVIRGETDWEKYGHVRAVEHENMILFTYTRGAMYDGTWNAFERMSRGLILHRETGAIIARPFEKFFNWGEGGRATNARLIRVAEKMDGSLGIAYRAPGGRLRVATRGSFDSEQAQHAQELVDQSGMNAWFWLSGFTLMFEIIYPANRIVVDYGDRDELVLLAVRNNTTGAYLSSSWLDGFAKKMGLSTPKTYDFSHPDDIVATLATLSANDEGYVAEFEDGQRFKFKGEQYLEIHRLLNGLSRRAVATALADGTIDDLESSLPEEFRAQYDEWHSEINRMAYHMLTAVQQAFEEAPQDTRKQFAQHVIAHHRHIAHLLFDRLDGKEIVTRVYQIIADTPDEEFEGLFCRFYGGDDA